MHLLQLQELQNHLAYTVSTEVAPPEVHLFKIKRERELFCWIHRNRERERKFEEHVQMGEQQQKKTQESSNEKEVKNFLDKEFKKRVMSMIHKNGRTIVELSDKTSTKSKKM